MKLVSSKNYGYLILDRANSIILPYFDTSSIIGKSIKAIKLSLWVLDIKPKFPEKVQITINLFNPLTNEIKDGLSAFIYPKDGNYVSFNLPLELFEKAVGTNNRFLIKIVDTVPKIVFAGPNQSGTTNDPKLNIEYSENTIPIPLPLEFFKIIGNIQNLQINYGGGNNMATNQDSKKENIFDKFFWKFLIPVAVVVVGAYLIYYFGIK
ncbi:MAG: hypothetical protein A2904_01165 [Candidatus Staskawiczbacteria bacterium RIFCSPLOWO2_01_FULL_33_9]|uniref:Uncharacterized protein n=1 Tax=Candidatus Staskawiczbacteria bacterium RIFCSPLOWO2_01_FULL_33_9 TaxID=1802211 RepID=A0A1G2I880_9BACT|nr:MAG: hypothetical protein A2904_01165 [Candidatus Staskawiczbacteria bacterium RIFCSPLOWO2_01_FULL_33_9]